MKRVLFICGKCRHRSPTAASIFGGTDDMEVDAAGLSNDADMPLENEQIAWATHLVVMEKAQAARLRRRFGNLVSGRKIVCLDIPDDYAFMNDDLIALLKQRIGRVQ